MRKSTTIRPLRLRNRHSRAKAVAASRLVALAPLRALRNIGMLGFDLVPGVRTLFAKHTMGLAGRLPRLSRGVPVK